MPARRHRITRGDDYRTIVRRGRRISGRLCMSYVRSREGGEPARFGFIVSKTVGNAVVRNRVRRRMKTVAERHIQAGLTEVDIVFRALPAIATAPYRDIEHEITRQLAQFMRPGVVQ